MNKPICICGVVIGALLVVFAALLVVAADPSSGTIDASQRLRLERTVSQLDGCLVCHDSPDAGDVEQVTLVVAPDPYDYLAYATNALHQDAHTHAVPQLSAAVRAEMLSLGQRILDLPVTDAEQIDALTADFLAVYDAAVAAESGSDPRSTLEALDLLKQQVRAFENQAHAVKLAASTTTDQTPDTIDALPASSQSPLPAVWAGDAVAVVTVTGQVGRVSRTQPVSAALVVTDDVQRRGPPAAFDNLLDSFV